jgi:hypothetical protein
MGELSMPELTIERLSLRLTGLSESESRRLPRLIAEGLAAAAPDVSGKRDNMRANINATAGSSVQQLSDQIVAELVRQLERSL